MLPVNRGVAMLAKRTGALVLPVGICGMERMWGKGKRLGVGANEDHLRNPHLLRGLLHWDLGKRESGNLWKRLAAEIMALCAEGGLMLSPLEQEESGDEVAG